MSATSFKRAAKVSLSIHKTDIGAGLRKVLSARIEPMVKYLASELAELAAQRFESELDRMTEALEVAVSAFVSEVANDVREPKPRATAEDWTALMKGPRMVLTCSKHACAEHFECAKRTRLCNCDECRAELDRVRGGGPPSPRVAVPEPAVAAEQGSTFFVGGAVNPPALVDLEERPNFRAARAAEIPAPVVAMYCMRHDLEFVGACPRCSIDRDIKPDNVIDEVAAAALAKPPLFVESLRKDGRRKGVTVCAKCGQVGGNARGCGKPTGHATRALGLSDQVNAALEKIIDTHYPDGVQPSKDLPPLPRKFKNTGFASFAVQPPVVRVPPEPVAKADRLAVLKERNAAQPADKPVASAEIEDSNPNASERWTSEEIDEERASAEARKLSGALPDPISSWSF